MDEGVAEGISTPLQTCSPIPQPYDLQEHLAFDPSPSPSFHLNDLGLTPPPGSQLMQSTDTQGSKSKEGNGEDPVEQSQSMNEDAFLFQGAWPAEFPDAIFDSEFALQMFQSSLDPRKRTDAEAFPDFDFLAPSEKRRNIEPPHNDISTPNDTPSLSSPDSSHRPDQGQTVPNTPGERSQTPDSLFDSLDPFEGLTFPDPAQIPSSAAEGLSSHLESRQQSGVVHEINRAPSTVNIAQPAGPGNQYHATPSTAPSVSSLTKQRFCLNDQDVIANAGREMLKRVDPKPEYVSPYPQYGGALGYLPSSPGIHVKCLAVAENRLYDRLANMKRRVGRVSYERDKYKAAWKDFTTVDEATGKSKEELLLEENSRLRRNTSKHQGQNESCKQEAEEWRNRFCELAMAYNNLLVEFQAQQRLAGSALPGTQPSGTSNRPCQPTAQHMSRVQASSPTVVDLGDRPATSNENSVAMNSDQRRRAASSANSVTIDLTDDRSPPGPSQNGAGLLQSFRNKRYGWLGNDSQAAAQRIDNPGEKIDLNTYDEDDDLAREMEQELARA